MERIALCSIGRLENAYAKEFVEYYKRLGFDKIFIYDNNHDGEERFEEVLSDYVNDGFVQIVDWRDKEKAQRSAYRDCYGKHGKEYGWIAFFDFDEFLTIVDGSDIHSFLEGFKEFDCVLVNWMNYTDSGLIRNDGRPVLERFTEPMPYDKLVEKSFPENYHVKSIVRGGLKSLAFDRNPHVPSTMIRCCNTKGEKCKNKPYQPYDFSVAYLRHFTTKTAEEWVNNKMVKGAADRTHAEFEKAYEGYFFKINEWTKEKEEMLNKRKGRVAAMALGRLGNQMFIAAAAKTFARRTGREFVGLVYKKGKNYDYDYPKEQFGTVMRNVSYVNEEDVSDFWKMEQGDYVSNGFPEVSEMDVILNDYYQDNTCIDRDIAFSLFSPYDSIIKEINDLYGDLSDYVCVNVRRGDYLKVEHLGFNVLTKEQIDAILNFHFRNDKILFVSDDIEWCKDNFIGDRYMFANRPCNWKPEMDLYLQTQCKANVISNSTFSWWGAYLNEKSKVVCPMPWFSDGKINDMNNILPKEWIRWEACKIWITYHKDELIDEYGLKYDGVHIPFAVHETPVLDNVNYMNPVWSEIVTMWYVWKNKLRSEIVGFNHYRRRVEARDLSGNDCVVYKVKRLQGETIRSQYGKSHNVRDLDDVISILNGKFWGFPYVDYLKNGSTLIPNCCFLMSWDNFDKLCQFMFPILEEYSEIAGCRMDVEKWREKATRDFDKDRAPYQMRLVGFLAERLISAWIFINLKWRKA